MASATRHHPIPRRAGLLIRARARIRMFARAQRGATAVEFAMVSVPFLLLIFAIIELGLVFLVSITLENAVIDAGRTIRTGAVQTAGTAAPAFKTATCAKMGWTGSACESALSLDVRTFTSYANSSSQVSATKPRTPCWDPGGPGSIVLIRAYYSWPLITPLLQTGLQTSNGRRLILATTAFTNEPYSDTAAAAVTCPAS